MRNVNALVLLVLAWAVLLLPGALRSRGRSPSSSVSGFARAMAVLRGDEGGVGAPLAVGAAMGHGSSLLATSGPGPTGRAGGESGAAGPSADRARATDRATLVAAARPGARVLARRRAWLARLLVASLGSAVAAAVVGGWAWSLLAAVVGTTVVYVVVLRRLELERQRARRTVASLDLHRTRVAAGSGGSTGAGDLGPGAAVRGGVPGDVPNDPLVSVGEWTPGATVRVRRWDG